MKKKIICLVLAFVFAFAAAIIVSSEDKKTVIDEANLLTSSQISELEEAFAKIASNHGMDVVSAVFPTIGYSTPMEYADDFYDANGYSKDGLILIVVLDSSDWYISTSGKAITAFTDAGIEYIGEKIVPYLSDGEYYDAFEKFAELCEDFITQYETGEPYDSNNLPKEPFLSAKTILISLAVGIIIAFLYTNNLKKQLITVRKQNEASNYVKDGEININTSTDLFLYRTMNRTAKESNSGSGGSSTHRSSSGSLHGGGGGKF